MGFDPQKNIVDDPPGIRDALKNAGVQFVDVSIPAASVQTLFTTPYEVVPAPGADKALIFDFAVLHKPAGTAYAGVAVGEDLIFKWTNAAGANVSAAVETTGFLDQATAQTRVVAAAGPATGATPGDVNPTANAAIVAHLLVGDITTGDSPLKVRLFYRVVPTVL